MGPIRGSRGVLPRSKKSRSDGACGHVSQWVCALVRAGRLRRDHRAVWPNCELFRMGMSRSPDRCQGCEVGCREVPDKCVAKDVKKYYSKFDIAVLVELVQSTVFRTNRATT